MIIYLPDISKSNLPMKLWGDKIVYKYSGDKICCVYLAVYNVLYLYISAPLSEARCSKNSDKDVLHVRHRSKAYIRVCIASKAASVLLLARYITEF
mgnify:FL=1